ncbi:MAG TPA: hypothetical protein VE465_13885 [Streptosporangiaceae bacterium]|jgi:hypothetical protein|nr:hypothetical protein [Streptosporangiaceae bacterium]
MADFKPGEHVRLTIDNVRFSDVSQIRVAVTTEDGEVWVLPPHAVIERVAPAEWPPQQGDPWRGANGGLLFATDVHDIAETDEADIVLVTEEGGRVRPEAANQRYGPMTLDHRKGEMAATDA